MTVKKMEHIGMLVEDIEKSISFYCDVVGMTLRNKMLHTEPSITLAFMNFPEAPETEIELIQGFKSNLPKEGVVHHVTFTVENLEEEIARLKKLNIQFVDENITTLPNGARYVFFYGPDGEWVEFFEPAR